MTDGMRANPELMDEYDNIFDSEDKISQAMKITKGDFSIDSGVVDFKDILVPDPLKKSRKETYLGLATSVSELGIVQPIHVMITEGYADWVSEGNDEEYEGYKYILIDGFRRIWAGYKSGLDRSRAIIWDFNDKDRGNDLALTLSRILNKTQDCSWGEKWYLYQILEAQSALTPGTLEYLLQLKPGDAMKLKDIMSCDYQEVIDELLSNKKTLDQVYNMLQKLRKEEDVLVREDNQGIADMEQADGIVEKSGDNVLSNEEVSEILEMDDGDLELNDDNFDAILEGGEPEVQKVGERHPLDPALKAESMLHDGYQCVCCGMGKYLPMRYKMTILQSHHKVSVANGGPDSVDNLATLCVACHTLVHTLLWSGLKYGMSKETFEELPDEEKDKLLKVMGIAKKDWDASIRLGKSHQIIKEENAHPSQFKMPGTDLNENIKAYKALKEKTG